MIKVLIQTEKFKGGPAVFRNRLISVLNKIEDIKVITDIKDKFDVELAFIRKTHKHKKPYILRVDGCYYQDGRKSGNRPLEESILNANYLVFQSNFSFNLCRKILNIDKKIKNTDFSIIRNGVDLDYIKSIEPNKDIKINSFVAGARWRDNKRTFSMLEGFKKAKIGHHLYVIGDGESNSYNKKMKKYESKYIHILGSRSEKETISIMKRCKYLIHLCHIDSCPNIVIEALSCGLNILCTNLGGTPEIVGDNGIILNVDKMWDGKYLSSSIKLDSLKSGIVADGVGRLLGLNTVPDAPGLNINTIADEYAKIIRKFK